MEPDINNPEYDNHFKRYKVMTRYKTFWFNELKNAEAFVILWLSGSK